MSYLQLYIYRVQQGHREEFLNIMRKARQIYHKYGADGEELFFLHNRKSKYGLKGLWEVLPAAEGEEIWIGLDCYQNVKQCEEVMKKVNADPKIDPLYERIIQLVGSASHIVRGEFEQVTY